MRRGVTLHHMLDPLLSRQRQSRLLDLLARRRCDAAVIASPQHVYYFTTHLPHSLHQAGLVLFADGRSILFTANSAIASAAADDVRPYTANRMSTLRDDQPHEVATLTAAILEERGARRVAIDASTVNSQLPLVCPAAFDSIESDLWQMRRVKDADELILMKRAIDCCEAMYDRARQIIVPGIAEIEVYAQLHAAAVATAGEPLSPPYLGNDYACGVPGGPARGDRFAGPGQLYILDLGPAYRGYFSDNARTFSVDRNPTDAQFQAHARITHCLRIVEQMARPGVRCRDLFAAVNQYLLESRGTGMTHHLGHGVGLAPHEFPHLNPEWDDTLLEGEGFTAEPGEYGQALQGGIRIENQYLVTASGVENLVKATTDL